LRSNKCPRRKCKPVFSVRRKGSQIRKFGMLSQSIYDFQQDDSKRTNSNSNRMLYKIGKVRNLNNTTQNLIFKRLFVGLDLCLSFLNSVSCINTFFNYIFRWSLSAFILWLRVFANMPSGIQHYWSIY
jgi:hypothetical protein